MNAQGFVCGPRLYQFKGWFFEWSACSGPWPLKINGDPRARAGRKFYAMCAEFNQLSEANKKLNRVGGGCQSF